MIRKYAEIFCWKIVSSFCSAKATHIFSAINIRILYIESAKTVNEMILNELVKLRTLWTTGPWLSANKITWSKLSIQNLYTEWQTVQIQISWLLFHLITFPSPYHSPEAKSCVLLRAVCTCSSVSVATTPHNVISGTKTQMKWNIPKFQVAGRIFWKRKKSSGRGWKTLNNAVRFYCTESFNIFRKVFFLLFFFILFIIIIIFFFFFFLFFFFFCLTLYTN